MWQYLRFSFYYRLLLGGKDMKNNKFDEIIEKLKEIQILLNKVEEINSTYNAIGEKVK